MSDANAKLREWIASGLAQEGKSQRGLARALGIDPASVNRVLSGARRLMPREIEPTARYLGVPPPDGFRRKPRPAYDRFIDLPAELRDEVFERACQLGIEPEEMLARAVRAAFAVLGPA